MSSKNKTRVKEFRQKTAENSYTSYPIGADAELIDMLSSLDLQEQLKIGGNCQISIQDDETFKISQKYYDSSNNNTKKVTYQVITEIQINTSNFIISDTQQSGSDITTNSQNVITDGQDGLIAQDNQKANIKNADIITITLNKYKYKDDTSNPDIITLHKKTIKFNNLTDSDMLITEEVQ